MSDFAQGLMNSISNTAFVKKKLMLKAVAKAMFYHCSYEYHNLGKLLLKVYEEEAK